ncbi:MAG: hypothetical protein K6F94_05115 [Bacteroidaceae bacterium]|nr:hypothetical protein [Bacteroidaceae bacterium]
MDGGPCFYVDEEEDSWILVCRSVYALSYSIWLFIDWYDCFIPDRVLQIMK